MTDQLGQIEKPTVESFGRERMLFVVPLLFPYADAPAEYSERLSRYWEQVRDHLARMEDKLGKMMRIYHETIFVGGEKGLELMARLNRESSDIASERCREGAQLEALDDEELVEESMDWERCLMLGFMSAKVAKMVGDLYAEASRKRYEHMSRRIDETLSEGERGILFIREGHYLQFPKGTQVFSVYPPALDEIHRWLRDRASAKDDQAERPNHADDKEPGEASP